MIIHRVEEETDKRLWDLYLINYKNMDKKNYKTFEQWKDKVNNKKKEERSNDDIMKEVERIKKLHLEKRGCK